MASKEAKKDKGQAEYTDPLKLNKFKDPLKKEHKDPLKAEPFKIPVVEDNLRKPYDTKILSKFYDYKPPDIDLLTGLPRKRKLLKPKEEKKPNLRIPLYQYGSPSETVKRTLRLQDNLGF